MNERAELRRLVAEMAIRGRLTSHAGPPSGWRRAPLGELAQLRLGKTPSTQVPEMWSRGDDEDGAPFVTIADLTDAASADAVVRSTRRRVSAHAAREVYRGRADPPGTLLLSFKLTLGQVAVTASAGFHNEAIVSVVPHEAALQPYLALVLPALVRQALPRAAMKGATLTRASLESLRVPLPPPEEQLRIGERARALDALGQRLAAARQREAELDARLTRRLLGAAVAAGGAVAGARFVDLLPEVVDRAAKIPLLERAIFRLALDGAFSGGSAGWRRVRLVDIASWAGGAGFPRAEQGHADRPVLFCKVSDMSLPENPRYLRRTVNTVDEATARRLGARIHPAGTVIFPKIGGAIATNKRRILARPAAMDNNCLGLTPHDACSPELLHLVLRAIDMTAYQREGPVPALNQARLEGIELLLPPKSEQEAITRCVDGLLARISALRDALACHESHDTRLARARERELLSSPLAPALW
jgi:type I restriction enzyme S subunit